MRKFTSLFIAATALMCLPAKAQNAFEEGKVAITIGYGFGNIGKTVFKAWSSEDGYQLKGLGPVHFKAEYGVAEKISVGASINYISYTATWDYAYYNSSNGQYEYYDYEVSRSAVNILGRMNLHFGTTENVDAYWGIGAGANIVNWNLTTNDPYDPYTFSFTGFPVGFETTVGLRYLFIPNLGLYMEIGYAKAPIQGGIALAF